MSVRLRKNGKEISPTSRIHPVRTKDGNGQKTCQLFSTTFEYENESESGKAEHENEHELMEYNELIRAELCRTRSVDEKSIWNRPAISSA
jgi:hypothetical protein